MLQTRYELINSVILSMQILSSTGMAMSQLLRVLENLDNMSGGQGLYHGLISRGLSFYKIKPLMPVGKKRSYILKQNSSLQLQVCLSMCDFFVTTRH